jgi:signal recognition particle subunit SEC65
MPRNLAIPSPKISEVKDAAETLRFNCEPVMDVAYPKTPWLKTGMILVGKKRSKDGTIREIAKQLLRLRNAPAAPTAK